MPGVYNIKRTCLQVQKKEVLNARDVSSSRGASNGDLRMV